MKEKVSKSAKVLLSIIGIFGLVTVGHSLAVASTSFSWPDLVVHLLYFACFVLMFRYLYKENVTSHTMFKYSLLIFGAADSILGPLCKWELISPQ